MLNPQANTVSAEPDRSSVSEVLLGGRNQRGLAGPGENWCGARAQSGSVPLFSGCPWRYNSHKRGRSSRPSGECRLIRGPAFHIIPAWDHTSLGGPECQVTPMAPIRRNPTCSSSSPCAGSRARCTLVSVGSARPWLGSSRNTIFALLFGHTLCLRKQPSPPLVLS